MKNGIKNHFDSIGVDSRLIDGITNAEAGYMTRSANSYMGYNQDGSVLARFEPAKFFNLDGKNKEVWENFNPDQQNTLKKFGDSIKLQFNNIGQKGSETVMFDGANTPTDVSSGNAIKDFILQKAEKFADELARMEYGQANLNQPLDQEALNARKKAIYATVEDAVYQSLGMGIGQTMGYNFKNLKAKSENYESAKKIYESLSSQNPNTDRNEALKAQLNLYTAYLEKKKKWQGSSEKTKLEPAILDKLQSTTNLLKEYKSIATNSQLPAKDRELKLNELRARIKASYADALSSQNSNPGYFERAFTRSGLESDLK